MESRPYSPADLPDVVALHREWDTHWFGAPEHDEAEVLEDVGRQDHSLLLHEDGRLEAAAWRWGTHTTLLVRPTADPGPLYDVLLPWLEQTGFTVLEALDRDEALLGVLEARGWRHDHSGFELIRQLDAWQPAAPQWPDGIRLGGVDDPAAVHALIYERTGWLDVPGHHFRSLEEWQSLFVNDACVPEQQVTVWSGEELVGAALCRMFSDSTGWVAQLAVARDQQGRGLGRALLLEALQRQVAAGATALGLGVSAGNRDALGLYLSIGLEIEREWRSYASIEDMST